MKKGIIAFILLLVVSLSIVSLYTTFAFDEETASLNESTSDYNIIYSMMSDSNRSIVVDAMEEKYYDIVLENVYDSNVRYGMYYYLSSPEVMPNGVSITLAEGSADPVEGIIKPKNVKSVSIKVTNNSDSKIYLTIGALIGFENGLIEDLVRDGEVLIK
jgi:hypothetical protein